jgi:glycosyltransferase involved in cell wall biosynthesis
MKILFITRTFYPGEGDSNYTFRLEKALKEKGHEVAFFTAENPRNIPSPYSRYFVNRVIYRDLLKQKSLFSIYKILKHSLFTELKEKIKKIIEDFKPDIVHLQHLDTHISPSALPVIKKYKIPIVYTLNVYTPLCINSTFINRKTNRICESCKPDRYFKILLNRCVRGSVPASALGMFFQYLNYFSKYFSYVDCFVCPSEFVKKKFVDYGFPPEKLRHLPYFFDARDISPRFDGDNYGLFFGRLVPEKGVDLLLRALQGTEIPFKIVGDGAEMQTLKDLANELELKNVEFLGYKFGDELFSIVSHSNFVVVPSKWYEVAGIVSLEAFACGKPVIGSRIGGISEIISENETGFLFDPIDVEKLRQNIIELFNNPELASRMGQRARLVVERDYNLAGHYTKLMDVYRSLIR